MANERRKYTEEFKREAVQLMESSGKTIAEIGRDLDINDNNLYRWRRLYGSQAQSNTHGNVAELAVELKRLQREVAVLRQERDILKKAMSIVSRSQP
jgi:transposase